MYSTGGAIPRFWTPTTPPTNCWPEAPGGGGIGGGVQEGANGGPSGRVGWGGEVQAGQFGVLGRGRGGTGSPYLPLPAL